MPFITPKTQGTRTIAGPQFQCLCRGLGTVGPVSSGISSGPILAIPWYFFNNIYLFWHGKLQHWYTDMKIGVHQMLLGISFHKLSICFCHSEDWYYHFLFGKPTPAFIICIYTSNSHFWDTSGSISDGLVVILNQMQDILSLKALFQCGLAIHCEKYIVVIIPPKFH